MMQTTPTEILLAELFENRAPASRSPHELHRALGWRPWWPRPLDVWERRELGPEPEMRGTGYAVSWSEAHAALMAVYAQYLEQRR